jgi:hypothetical protein
LSESGCGDHAKRGPDSGPGARVKFNPADCKKHGLSPNSQKQPLAGGLCALKNISCSTPLVKVLIAENPLVSAISWTLTNKIQ